MAFIPTTVLLLIASLLSLVVNPDNKLVRLIVHTGTAGLLPAMFWWAWGAHSKSMKLLAKARTVAALLAFLFSVFGFWMIWWMTQDIFRIRLEPQSSYARFLSECEKKVDKWIGKPWTVIALPEINRIEASGTIGEGSARALERVILANPKLKLVQLDSRGGLMREQILIIDVLSRNRMDTLVTDRCASACTGIFLAGQRRFVTPDANFAFHRSGYCGKPLNAPLSTFDYMTSIFYREREIQEDFLTKALEIDYYDMWKPSALEIKKSGFATHWWSDRPREYALGVDSQ